MNEMIQKIRVTYVSRPTLVTMRLFVVGPCSGGGGDRRAMRKTLPIDLRGAVAEGRNYRTEAYRSFST